MGPLAAVAPNVAVLGLWDRQPLGGFPPQAEASAAKRQTICPLGATIAKNEQTEKGYISGLLMYQNLKKKFRTSPEGPDAIINGYRQGFIWASFYSIPHIICATPASRRVWLADTLRRIADR